MRLKPSFVKRFLWMSAGPLALAAVLAAASPSLAAEDARFIPAKRPGEKAAASVAARAPLANVRVISIPREECPADDNEGMNAVKAFIDPATGELRAPTQEEEAGAGPRDRATVRTPAQAAREVHGQRQRHREPIELGEDGMEDVVVRTGADGKPVFFCTPRSETPKALTRPLAPKKSDAAKEEK